MKLAEQFALHFEYIRPFESLWEIIYLKLYLHVYVTKV